MGRNLAPDPANPRVRELVRSQSDRRNRIVSAAAIWIVLGALGRCRVATFS